MFFSLTRSIQTYILLKLITNDAPNQNLSNNMHIMEVGGYRGEIYEVEPDFSHFFRFIKILFRNYEIKQSIIIDPNSIH